MEVNVITLENNREYIIIDTVQIGESKYLFLASETDEFDKCVRKVILKEGKEYLTKLASDEEFEDVMTALNEKHRGNGEN